MKLLVVVLAALAGVWLWRRGRLRASAMPRQRASACQQPMLSCAVCGLHVPQSEAVTGAQGSYCGAEHWRQAEGR